MNLIEWSPFREFDHFSPFKTLDTSAVPKVDVYQTKTDVVVTAEIPGIAKDNLDVYATDNAIRISAERKNNDEYENQNIYRSERYYGTFYRVIALPAEINTDNVKASYQDGVLSIVASKTNSTNAKQHKVVID